MQFAVGFKLTGDDRARHRGRGRCGTRVNPMEGKMTYLQRHEVVFSLAGVALAQAMLGRAGAALATDKIKPSASSALIVGSTCGTCS